MKIQYLFVLLFGLLCPALYMNVQKSRAGRERICFHAVWLSKGWFNR